MADEKSITINLPKEESKPKPPSKVKEESAEKKRFDQIKKDLLTMDWDDFEIYCSEMLRNQGYKLRIPSHAPSFEYDGFEGKTLSIDDIFSVIDGTDTSIHEFLARGLPSGRSWNFRLVKGAKYICGVPAIRLLKAGDRSSGASETKNNEPQDTPNQQNLWQSVGELGKKANHSAAALGGVLFGLAEIAKVFKPEPPPPAPVVPAQDDKTNEILKQLLAIQKDNQQQAQEERNRSELAEIVKAFTARDQQTDTDQMIKLMTVMNQGNGKSDADTEMVRMILEQMLDQSRVARAEMKELAEALQSGSDPIEQMERIEEFKARLAPTLGGTSTPPIATKTDKPAENSTLDRLADVAVGIFEGVQKRQQQANHNQSAVEAQQQQQQQELVWQQQAQMEAQRIGGMVDSPVEDPTAAPMTGINTTPPPPATEEEGHRMSANEQQLQSFDTELRQMLDQKLDGLTILQGVRRYVEFAHQNELILHIEEIVESQGDLLGAFERFVMRRSDDQEYIQQVVAAAEPFRAMMTGIDLGLEADPTASELQDEQIISIPSKEQAEDDIQSIDLGGSVPDDAPAKTSDNHPANP